jgi:hypothetical protein
MVLRAPSRYAVRNEASARCWRYGALASAARWLGRGRGGGGDHQASMSNANDESIDGAATDGAAPASSHQWGWSGMTCESDWASSGSPDPRQQLASGGEGRASRQETLKLPHHTWSSMTACKPLPPLEHWPFRLTSGASPGMEAEAALPHTPGSEAGLVVQPSEVWCVGATFQHARL